MWLMISHWSELDVLQAILLFAYIDLIGTVPGLWAYIRSPNGQISKVYYHVYNFLHSFVTQGVVMIAYVGLFGWQWCLLGIPTHLFIDRFLFNNYPKPLGVAFDPVKHPVFAKFEREYAEFDSGSVDWKAVKKNENSLTGRR
ncbi:hypothetical protein [Saccharothrix deserti]|uniref:hypothetical protein n=1 Tax=Saccharothrix deserti TaxID=2593674 RepID=UPI00131C5F77|nr:hypothetical protein [Saccharothrix deserti]